MSMHEGVVVHVEGIGWWSPDAPDWPSAMNRLRETSDPPTGDHAGGRPAAAILPANERRRAPEPVKIACEVAAQACAMANRDPASVACVFASMHGDIATTDALCATLASNPLEVSPTRFHNSVHNAPAGYWTVATGCQHASNAVSAWQGSFAAGLFETAIEASADGAPILFACYDIAACGALADVVFSDAPFGVALLINAQRSARSIATLRLRHASEDNDVRDDISCQQLDAARVAPVALLAALARGDSQTIRLANGARTSLLVEVMA